MTAKEARERSMLACSDEQRTILFDIETKILKATDRGEFRLQVMVNGGINTGVIDRMLSGRGYEVGVYLEYKLDNDDSVYCLTISW